MHTYRTFAPHIFLILIIPIIALAEPANQATVAADLNIAEVLAGSDRAKKLEVLSRAGAYGSSAIRAQSEITKFLMQLGNSDNELQSAGLNALSKISGKEWKPSDVLINKPVAVRKPAIYLYSGSREPISIHIETSFSIDISFPKFNAATHSWKVATSPEGQITIGDNRSYSYLFWEASDVVLPKIDLSTGFIVPGHDAREFLQQKLSEIGLTVQEANDFVVYWYPLLIKNELNYVRFLFEEYEQIARLKIEPAPDSILRVFMVYKPLKEIQKLSSQKLPHFERKGFTVVDWGGAILP